MSSWPQQIYPHAIDCPNLLLEIESRRQSRHHDMVLLMSKELMCGHQPWPDAASGVNPRVASLVDVINLATYAADLAYPPPKDKP